MSRVWAEIDLEVSRANVRAVKDRVGRECKVMAVVKANAYGMGGVEMARALLQAGASSLAVASVSEGAQLRQAGIRAPILVLGTTMPGEMTEGIAAGLTLTVSSAGEIAEVFRAAATLSQPVGAQLKVDTGMHRLGMPPADAIRAALRCRHHKLVSLEGAYTHFAHVSDMEYTRHQLDKFLLVRDRLQALGVHLPCYHAANSAAICQLPASWLDVVRPGGLLHGCNPFPSASLPLALRPVMALRARVAAIRRVPKGATVGYCRAHRCENESLIATITAGYHDGYPRTASGRGAEILARGVRVPVVGNICMDYLMADVTRLADHPAGLPERDEPVTLIGAEGEERISVEEVAAKAGSVSYQVLCGIGGRTRRQYLNELPLAEPCLPADRFLPRRFGEHKRSA